MMLLTILFTVYCSYKLLPNNCNIISNICPARSQTNIPVKDNPENIKDLVAYLVELKKPKSEIAFNSIVISAIKMSEVMPKKRNPATSYLIVFVMFIFVASIFFAMWLFLHKDICLDKDKKKKEKKAEEEKKEAEKKAAEKEAEKKDIKGSSSNSF